MARRNPNDYTVAWICPLPQVNLASATQLLDERHLTIIFDRKPSHEYVYGTVCGHNVVIGCPANRGIPAASHLAAEMTFLFRNLRFAVLVGVGSGIPRTTHDLRTGDVVVGLPDKQHGGVVQHDFKKATHNGKFHRIGLLNNPPTALLSAIGLIHATPAGRSKFVDYLTQSAQDFPTEKMLCRASSGCANKPPCQCTSREFKCKNGLEPKVHYGLILSGDQLVETAVDREEVVKRVPDGLLFEHEAAGIVNQLPTLVIQGIGSFGEQDGAFMWHIPAAAAAASYAKELLRNVTPWSNTAQPFRHEAAGVVRTQEAPRQNTGLRAMLGCERGDNDAVLTRLISLLSWHIRHMCEPPLETVH